MERSELRVFKVVFEGEATKWGFYYNGIKITASILDSSFMDSFRGRSWFESRPSRHFNLHVECRLFFGAEFVPVHLCPAQRKRDVGIWPSVGQIVLKMLAPRARSGRESLPSTLSTIDPLTSAYVGLTEFYHHIPDAARRWIAACGKISDSGLIVP